METYRKLPGRLEIFFRLGFRLFVISAVVQLVGVTLPLIFPGTKTNDIISATRRFSYDRLSIALNPHAATVRTKRTEPGNLAQLNLHGFVWLDLNRADSDLSAIFYQTVFPGTLIRVLYFILLFGMLRDLCGRIKHGDVFSDKNLRAVRGIGLLLVIGSLVDAVIIMWSAHRLAGYFARNATIEGLDATIAPTPTQVMTAFDFSQVLTGLLVLLVAEAFRQGLALKKENDLTV
jgi:hypothetical protein